MKNFYTELAKELNKPKRILITGGAGFIGGCLVKYLLRNSDFMIFNLDKISYCSDNKSIEELIKSLGISKLSKYSFLKVNLLEYEPLLSAIELVDPDVVIHLAAESHVDKSIFDPRTFVESNIIGTYNILEACKKHFENLDKKRRKEFIFHHVSTDEVYGSLGKKGTFSEDSKYMPNSPYSASKASSDHLVKAWNSTYGLPVVITNCSNNFGPYQFPEKLIPVTITKALRNQSIPIYGDGSNVRDWLYVEDHIEAILLVAFFGIRSKTYCIGASNEKTNLELVEEICSLLDILKPKNESYKQLISFTKDRLGHDQRYSIDASLIRRELGWIPKYTFEEGLHKTIKWYLENEAWIDRMNQNK